MCPLREPEVIATSCDRLDDLSTKSVVAFVLGEIEFCENISELYLIYNI